MDEGRKDHLQMIQGIIDRMAQNSFQLKGWTVTLAAALEVFLKGEARPAWLFVPSLPVIAFWLLDAWYLRRERLFRRLFDHVRTENGPAGFLDGCPSFRRRSRASARRCHVADHYRLLRSGVVGRNPFGTVSSSLIQS